MSGRQRREEPRHPPDINGVPPPIDLDAEAACISAMMLSASSRLNPDAVATVRDECDDIDFFSEANRTIVRAIFALDDQGIPADIVTVKGRLKDEQKLEQVGGTAYLVQLIDATPAVANLRNHARIVRQKAVVRRKIAAVQAGAAFLYNTPAEEAEEHVEAMRAALDEPVHRNVETSRASLGAALGVAMDALVEQQRQQAEHGGRILGTSTGVPSVDEMTGGLHEGETVFVSGPTGNGKTSWAAQVGLHVGRTGGERHATELDAEGEPRWVPFGVAIFTLEMPREEYAMRMACSYGRVDFSSIRTGKATLEDWTRLRAAQIELHSLPIEIDDGTKLTPRELERRIVKIRREMLARGARLRLVIVDQIQLMAPSDAPSRNATEESTLFGIGRDLRAISQAAAGKRETLMVLSQENVKGQLSRCSALKQHAVSWFGVKVDKTESDAAWRSNRYAAEITIRKQRFGSSPETLPMWFEGPFARFEDGRIAQTTLPSNVVPIGAARRAAPPDPGPYERDDEVELGADGSPL